MVARSKVITEDRPTVATWGSGEDKASVASLAAAYGWCLSDPELAEMQRYQVRIFPTPRAARRARTFPPQSILGTPPPPRVPGWCLWPPT